MGMSPDEIKARVAADEAPVVFGVWPENWPAFCVFEAMRTQWRVGMGGYTGLDYAALPACMKLCEIKAADRTEVFERVRQMENEALKFFDESRPHGD